MRRIRAIARGIGPSEQCREDGRERRSCPPTEADIAAFQTALEFIQAANAEVSSASVAIVSVGVPDEPTGGEGTV